MWILSEDICYEDVGGVILDDGGDLEDYEIVDAYFLCVDNNTDGWISRTIDLSAFAGRRVELIFLGGTDSILISHLFIDTASISANLGIPSTSATAEHPLRLSVEHLPSRTQERLSTTEMGRYQETIRSYLLGRQVEQQ